MPELPEVETVKNGLKSTLANQVIKQVIVNQPALRFTLPVQFNTYLENNQIKDISRRGKYLIFSLQRGFLIVHLGMTGIFRLFDRPAPEAQKHDHITFLFDDMLLRYNDVRRFGFMLYTENEPSQHKLLRKLGPEPLSAQLTAAYLLEQCRNKKTPIKTILMNHNIVVGIGNIYANEILFQCGIHPISQSGNLSIEQCQSIVDHTQAIIKQSIIQGGTTLKDFKNTSGKPGYFAQSLSVYGRKHHPCPRCGEIIESTIIAQRSSFFCHCCQRVY